MSQTLKLIVGCALCIQVLSSYAIGNSKAFYAKSRISESPSISNVGVILLAGGKGKRMKSAMPKQFLPILGRPVFLRSLDVFTSMKCVSNIVIVLDESFRDEYADIVKGDSRIAWADPGTERQVQQKIL